MTNNQKAEYIFQQLVIRGAALPHTAVLCIETALNDLEIEAIKQGVQMDGEASDGWGILGKCSICGKPWEECFCLRR